MDKSQYRQAARLLRRIPEGHELTKAQAVAIFSAFFIADAPTEFDPAVFQASVVNDPDRA